MNPMLEKAAIALYMADYPGSPGHPDDSETDAMMFEKYRDHYLSCVRAALLAIREPDAQVIAAGVAGIDAVEGDCATEDGTAAGFTAMIDAILGDEKP